MRGMKSPPEYVPTFWYGSLTSAFTTPKRVVFIDPDKAVAERAKRRPRCGSEGHDWRPAPGGPNGNDLRCARCGETARDGR